MKYQLVVFDLDGTVLDTLDDLTDSLNHVFALHSMPLRTRKEVRSIIGNGIKNLITLSAPSGTSAELIDRLFADYTLYYKEHCADKTVPYAGMIELIERLRAEGVKTALVSNKGDYAVKELVKKYFDGLFDFAAGERDGVRRKPAPDTVIEAVRTLSADLKSTVYVGDSEVDILTAQNAETDIIAVSWGFRDREVLKEKGAPVIADTPEELYSFLSDAGK